MQPYVKVPYLSGAIKHLDRRISGDSGCFKEESDLFHSLYKVDRSIITGAAFAIVTGVLERADLRVAIMDVVLVVRSRGGGGGGGGGSCGSCGGGDGGVM